MKSKILASVLFLSLTACTAPFGISAFARPTPTTIPTIVPTLAPLPTSVPTPAPIATTRATIPTAREKIILRDLGGAGRSPIALTVLDGKAYVANLASGNVAVIQNDRVTKYLPVGNSPADIVADPIQKRVYVANRQDHSISLIINDQVTLTTSVGEEPGALAFLDNQLFVGLESKGTILVVDAATLKIANRIDIPNAFGVISMSADPVHHRLYASPYEKIAVIDSTNFRVLAVHALKSHYMTLLANPNNDSVLATTYESTTNSNLLRTIDPLTGATRGNAAPVGGDPRGAAMNREGTRAYIANSFSNSVSVIEPREMKEIATIPVGLAPNAVALDETARRLYVANYDGDSVNIIDTQTNTVIATVPLAMNLARLEANEKTGRVFVASATTDSVFAIDGTHVVKEIGVNRHPLDLARDAQSNRLFVANYADNTLTVIDETSASIISATKPITRFVGTVAVDAPRARLFAGSMILDLNSLNPIGSLTMQGATIGSVITPGLVRVNSKTNRIYANGNNGTPGSNSRYVTYSIDGGTLKQRGIGMGYYGNTSAFEIDPENNRVYLAGTHPLALTNTFTVFDADDNIVLSIPLYARTAGMAYNPQTHHLFLSQMTSYSREFGATPTPIDDSVLILDTTTFGVVGQLDVKKPGKMTRVGNLIYIASRDDGSMTIVEDVPMPPPPAPTPTRTPSPYPTLTNTPVTPTRLATPVVRPPTPMGCGIQVTGLASKEWTPDVAAKIGCPTQTERATQFGIQPFERGTMFYRADEKRIYALFNDNTWQAFDDTWVSSSPADSCPSVSVGSRLVKPQRGFGRVWCEQTSVRAKLGAATATERGLYNAQTQRFERGQMFAGEQASQVFVLYADGKWD